ncbi:MAG: hypothetical protein ACXVFT_08855 [Solirubrobacteraceae bacterium]
MAQNFVACDRDQELLLPPSLREPPAPTCAITSAAPPAYRSVAPPDLASSQPPGQ